MCQLACIGSFYVDRYLALFKLCMLNLNIRLFYSLYTSHGWIITVGMCVFVCVCWLEEEQKERVPQALNVHLSESEKSGRAVKTLVHTPSLHCRLPVSAMSHNVSVM